MERLSVRLTDRTFLQLDGLAAERGLTRTQVVRQYLEAGLRDRPQARMGNVVAIRTLLVREEQKDPRKVT